MVVILNIIRMAFTRLWPFLSSLGLGLLTSFAKWGMALSVAGLLGFTDIGKEVMLWSFDNILYVLDYIISLVILPDALKTFSLQALFDTLPGQVLGLLGYVGIPQGLSIIAAAFTIRLTRDILRF